MMKKIIAVAAFLLCTTAAQAGIVMGGTRVIYQEGKREAAISVTNADTHTPYLVQSWVENYAENDKARVPFIVTPPLFRLDPEQNNVPVSYTHLRAHETRHDLVCRLLLEKKKKREKETVSYKHLMSLVHASNAKAEKYNMPKIYS